MMRALKHRNYALFFFGQGISLIGTWMQGTALGWLVYDLVYGQANSKFKLGLVGFLGQIMTFLVTPLAGVYTDRWNRHRVLLVSQVLLMIQATMLAVLTLSGHITYVDVVALAVFAGVVMAVDIPNRQSFMFDLVDDRRDLPNAIALNSFAFNGARLVAPIAAGVLIKVIGEGWCFAINAASFIAVIVSVLAMRVRPPVARVRKHAVVELLDGMRYAYGFAPIRAPLILLGTMGLFAMSYGTLFPVFARDILHGQWGLDGEIIQGLLLAAAGLGAIFGALFLANRRSILGLDRILGAAPVVVGCGMIAFGLSRWLALSLPMLVVVGFGLMVQMAGTNMTLQTIVEDDKRGRVMSFYAISFLGTGPVGALLSGSLAQAVGAPLTLAMSGGACIVASLIFLTQLPRLRRASLPIYRKLGLLS